MALKEKIINCFNSGAYTYDAAVDVQQVVAAQLKQEVQSLPAQNILELGCGTGLFSQQLTSVFPRANFLLTDIAEEMVSICKQRFATNANVNTTCMDGEALKLSSHYDLIVSSMAMHWFSDIEFSIEQIIKKLTPAGHFVFAMLGNNSLVEWRQLCHSHNVSVPTPVFPDYQNIQKKYPVLKIKVGVVTQHYQSIHKFLTTLKLLGAHAPAKNHIPLAAGALRRMMRKFDSDGINISYEIIYGCYVNS